LLLKKGASDAVWRGLAQEMGQWPIFLLESMQKAAQSLVDLVRGVVEPMGYELVGVEQTPQGGGSELLRVYIDKASGIRLEDCTAVSHQLSGVLDVEDPIAGEYTLEVSSPGLDRPLFELAHFQQFAGSQAKLKLGRALDGRRNFRGQLVGVEDDDVLMLVDGETYRLPFGQIESARLVPQF